MTMPIKFDTLEYARKLVEAGIPADQADAHAQALSDALATASATPAELVLVRSELLARMDMLKSEVYARIDLLQSEVYARIDLLQSEVYARIDLLKTEIYGRLDLLKSEIDARLDRFDARLESKLRPLRWLLGVALVAQVATLGLVGVLLARLPI
ncbi:MAG TPA: hypothetical protein VF616_22950 [Duganella sp.]|uniref:hypothetical protein n=1 Tax=Duganella sp. TaxID=1904440 RepID=UPI002ED62838